MTVKLAADVMKKLAEADVRDQQNAWDHAFLKTAHEVLGLDRDEAIKLRIKFAEAVQAAQRK